MRYYGKINYINTESNAISVAKLISILQTIPNKDMEIYIYDDNAKIRPVVDIAISEDNKNLLICDF